MDDWFLMNPNYSPTITLHIDCKDAEIWGIWMFLATSGINIFEPLENLNFLGGI